jgi:hypothetical protein
MASDEQVAGLHTAKKQKRATGDVKTGAAKFRRGEAVATRKVGDGIGACS